MSGFWLMLCFFASDLHGSLERYQALVDAVAREHPEVVFLGGDLLPSGILTRTTAAAAPADFVASFLRARFETMRQALGRDYPRVMLVLGNDDPASAIAAIEGGEADGLWQHVNLRKVALDSGSVYGYSYVPPTPFLLKDWERYDVSRFVDPGCVSPEEGLRTVPVDITRVRFGSIARDLRELVGNDDLVDAVLLCHAPPYRTALDRAALDGTTVEGVPLDPHVGSIALRRLIEERQPKLSLHGHVHESARLTGAWQDRIGRTVMLSAAHDGPELALVRFDLENPLTAVRELLSTGPRSAAR